MNKKSIALTRKIYKALSTKKFKEIEILDVHELTALTDVFIIVVAENNRQTKALVDEIEFILQQDDIVTTRKEGYLSARWILLDYEDVIVHVLCKEEAEFYGLPRLWRDATTLVLDELIK